MEIDPDRLQAFEKREGLSDWLRQNYNKQSVLWVRIYKKSAGVPTVSVEEVIEFSLAWGWIDGMKKGIDASSYGLRITPRKPKSNWSARNIAIAERLIAEGRMEEPGMALVQTARAEGRWSVEGG